MSTTTKTPDAKAALAVFDKRLQNIGRLLGEITAATTADKSRIVQARDEQRRAVIDAARAGESADTAAFAAAITAAEQRIAHRVAEAKALEQAQVEVRAEKEQARDAGREQLVELTLADWRAVDEILAEGGAWLAKLDAAIATANESADQALMGANTGDEWGRNAEPVVARFYRSTWPWCRPRLARSLTLPRVANIDDPRTVIGLMLDTIRGAITSREEGS